MNSIAEARKSVDYVLECVLMCYVLCGGTTVRLLPLYSEAEMACAGLYLVLGLEVIHALCGNAINGQNDVSNIHLGLGCLASISELQ